MARIRLTGAQMRWLEDPRRYSNPWRDRTFRALIDNAIVVVDQSDGDPWQSGKMTYKLTERGKRALAAVRAKRQHLETIS